MGQITIKSEIAAKVWKIEVGVGTQVPEGETVILLESMKMEISHPRSGRRSHRPIAGPGGRYRWRGPGAGRH